MHSARVTLALLIARSASKPGIAGSTPASTTWLWPYWALGTMVQLAGPGSSRPKVNIGLLRIVVDSHTIHRP